MKGLLGKTFIKGLLGNHLDRNVYPTSDAFFCVNGKIFNRPTWYHNLKTTLKALGPVLLGTAQCLFITCYITVSSKGLSHPALSKVDESLMYDSPVWVKNDMIHLHVWFIMFGVQILKDWMLWVRVVLEGQILTKCVLQFPVRFAKSSF